MSSNKKDKIQRIINDITELNMEEDSLFCKFADKVPKTVLFIGT